MTELNIISDVCFGENSLDALMRYDKKNIVIFTDPFLTKTKKVSLVCKKLVGNNVFVYDNILPDPSIEQVRDCYAFACENSVDVIIAFGGGSAIDTAKAVIMVFDQASPEKCIELVAIPTTSGTGSEATFFSVISDTENGVKYPIVDAKMAPALAILDAEFTKTMPGNVTANTGMDVITHILEAYVSTSASVISDAFAEKGVVLAFDALQKAYDDGNDMKAREDMLMSSYLAGLAFNNAGLGINHSIAHGLGANFHLSHGLANAMLLPHVIAFNSSLDVPFGMDKSVAAGRYAIVAQKIGLNPVGTRMSVLNLIKKIYSMLTYMKMPRTLAEAGIKREDFEKAKPLIVKSTLEDACTPTNPRKPSEKDIEKILDLLYFGVNW